ncbi:transposase, partial [Bacillus sp. SA1-12]
QGKTVGLQAYDDQLFIYYNTELIVQHQISQLKINYKDEHYKAELSRALPYYPDIDHLAKKNLETIGDVYKNE